MAIYKLRRIRKSKFSNVLGYPNTTQAFAPGIKRNSRQLNLGLSDEELRQFEKELGLKENDMTPALKPDGQLVSEFWKRYKLEIPPNGLDLDESQTNDRLAIKLLKVSSKVSLQKGAPSATAMWELYTEVDTAKTINQSRQVKKKAYAIFDKMTATEMRDYLVSIGDVVDNTEPEIIEQLVGNDVESKPDVFINRVTNPMYKERIMLNGLINSGVLTKLADAIYFKDILLGMDMDSSIAFLNKKDENSQKLKIAIQREYELSKGSMAGIPEEQEEEEPVMEMADSLEPKEETKED